jgi:hypothetical protein
VPEPPCSWPSSKASCSSCTLYSDGFSGCVLYVAGSRGAGHRKGCGWGYQPLLRASGAAKVPGTGGSGPDAFKRALIVSCRHQQCGGGSDGCGGLPGTGGSRSDASKRALIVSCRHQQCGGGSGVMVGCPAQVAAGLLPPIGP